MAYHDPVDSSRNRHRGGVVETDAIYPVGRTVVESPSGMDSLDAEIDAILAENQGDPILSSETLPDYDDGALTIANLEENLRKLDPSYGEGEPEPRKEDDSTTQQVQVNDPRSKEPVIDFDSDKVEEKDHEGKPVDENDPAFRPKGESEKDVSDKVDPFKQPLEETAPKGENFDKNSDAIPNSTPHSAMAANLTDSPEDLTVSAIEACPEGCDYAARITNPGQRAILFAVTRDGAYLPIMELNRNLSPDSYSDFFSDQGKLDNLIYNITKDGGYTPSLRDFETLGGKDFRFSIPVHAALNKRISDGISNVTASMKRDDEAVEERFKHSLEIAAVEAIKRIRDDVPNEVRENLVSKLKGFGIEDAASIVDNAFRESGQQFVKDILARTKVLASKSDEVRNEAAENAAQSKFKAEGEHRSASGDTPNHDVAASLAQGSTPFYGTSPAPSHEATASGESEFMRKYGAWLGHR